MRSEKELTFIAETLGQTSGVLAVLVANEDEVDGSPRAVFYKDKPVFDPRPELASALELMRAVDALHLRVIYEHLTLVAMRWDGVDVVVKIPQGHAVMKSLLRMTKRLLVPGKMEKRTKALASALDKPWASTHGHSSEEQR